MTHSQVTRKISLLPLTRGGSLPLVLGNLALGALFVLCAMVAESEFAGMLSLAGMFVFFVLLTKEDPAFILKYLYFFFAVYANVIGCAICEFSDFYLRELSTFAAFAGSLPLLVLSRWVFLLVLLLFERGFRKRCGVDSSVREADVQKRMKWIGTATTLVLLLCAVEFLDVCYRPSFLMGMSRFDYYAAGIQSSLLAKLGKYLEFFIVIPLISIRYGDRRQGIAAVMLYVLYLLFIGNKFGPFFSLLCLALLVFSDAVAALPKEKITAILGAAMALLVAIASLSVVLYTALYHNSSGLEYFSQRTAQQGQLWWKTYDLLEGESHPEEFAAEISNLSTVTDTFSENIGADYGIYKIMYFTAPRDQVDRKLATNSRYTEAGYACAYYYFGVPGILLFSLAGALLASVFCNGLVLSVRARRVVLPVLLSRLYSLVLAALSMFAFAAFMKIASLASVALLIVVLLMGWQRFFGHGLRVAARKSSTDTCNCWMLVQHR